MRKKVEKAIVRALANKVSDKGFRVVKEDYASQFNHIVRFEKTEEESVFGIDLRFMLPNYLKLQVQFTSSNDSINTFYSTTCKLEEGWYPLLAINFDMDDFFANINSTDKDGFYVTNDSGFKGVDIEIIAQKIFDKYFVYALNELIPSLNSIDKLSNVINASQKFGDENIELHNYCYPIQSQILAGVALTLIMKKENWQLIAKKYLNFCKKDFRTDKDVDIDKLVSFLEGIFNK